MKPDQFDKGVFPESDSLSGRYATKLRRSCARTFTKRAV